MGKRIKEPWEKKRPKPTIQLPPPEPKPAPAGPLPTAPLPADLANLSVEDLLRGLGALITFNAKRLYRTDGTPIALDELDDNTALAIQALEVTELYGEERVNIGVLKKIRQYDRIRAIETYAELKGWKNGGAGRGEKLNLLREYMAALQGTPEKK